MKNPMLKSMLIATLMMIVASPLFGFEKRDLAPFLKIEINGAFKVALEQGDKEQVEVVIDSSKPISGSYNASRLAGSGYLLSECIKIY